MVATRRCNNFRRKFVKRAPLRSKIISLYWVLRVNKVVFGATLDSMVRTLDAALMSPFLRSMGQSERGYIKNILEEIEENEFYSDDSKQLLNNLLNMWIMMKS
uniref:Uncharacterized protein n=1 Tax=Tetranychus urticae TaxID=32264 RepID=T1KZC3_TETUR